jgi:hypothetical protein
MKLLNAQVTDDNIRVKKNILKPVRTGVYMLSAKPSFNPAVEQRLTEIGEKVNKQFPMVKFCFWITGWLNDWMIHQLCYCIG